MIGYKHILAVVDTRPSSRYALNKALILSARAQAKLTLLEVTPKGSLLTRLTQPNSDANPFIIYEDLLAQYRKQGVEVAIKTRLNNRLSRAILGELEQDNYDLVILNYKHHNPLFHKFSFADEWRLLRESDVAVMLVGAHDWEKEGHILTAIETDDSSRKHTDFNRKLLEETEHLARLLNNDIHLLNCFQEQNLSMAVTQPKEEQQPLNEESRHWMSLVDSAKPYHLEDSHLHLEEGLADHIIPDMAKRYRANVVILGSGEHHGLLSQLKGHTSEQIIDQLNCDIFAIKPASV
ncbi:universal stress protein [uncultured Shewanella sp.]|uniref:universal stress protein n=1 Tax=uncultured Shewanella sp. TaxID=173975 RepID=UPI00262A4582|nr:universal stress protein [uncultured Shewanella sp.]